NTTIPVKQTQVFSTAADGQTSVDVHELQGEREMASYNKTLGRFQLTGIAPAPSGVPLIEVSFDIDANGIVHVSAKDLGTGKEQSIAITASSNMTEEEIKKAVDEAEQYAAEDKKHKEEVETVNQADSLIYQTEKTMKDLGDKLDPADRAKLESELADFRKVRETNDAEQIRSAMERFSQSSMEIFAKVYQQAGGDPTQQQPGGGSTVNDDGSVDAEFTDGGDGKYAAAPQTIHKTESVPPAGSVRREATPEKGCDIWRRETIMRFWA
ncbi:MAG: Hsp70 family protein, partial [Clostridia bacterium]|nr:Hsp70 family protein [Clostridia bacterium]